MVKMASQNPMHNYLSIVQRLAEIQGMATAASLQAEVDHREVLADIADLAGEVNEDLQEAVLRGGGVRIGGVVEDWEERLDA